MVRPGHHQQAASQHHRPAAISVATLTRTRPVGRGSKIGTEDSRRALALQGPCRGLDNDAALRTQSPDM
jgi:hypothetical protein